MRTKNDELQNQKQAVVLTPARQKLLQFLEPQEIPSLIQDFKRVFDLAAFFVDHDLCDQDRTALFMQDYFIGLLAEMEKEQVECSK